MRLLTGFFWVTLFLGPAAAQSSKPDLSPCALVTKAEIQAAVGSPASEGTINKTQKSICDFHAGDASVVSVMLIDKSPGDTAEKMVAAMKKQKVIAEVTSGFGDSAYVSSAPYGMQQLAVFKGSNHVLVSVIDFGAPEAKLKTIAQVVMRKALARLP